MNFYPNAIASDFPTGSGPHDSEVPCVIGPDSEAVTLLRRARKWECHGAGSGNATA